MNECIGMVRTGLEKPLKEHHVLKTSLKIENWKLWDILEKSLNFPQKSLNILKAPWIKKHLLKKVFCAKERLKVQQYANCLGDHESVFLWFRCSRHRSISVIWSTLGTVPSWGRCCNKQTPLHLQIWEVFTSCHSMSNYRKKTSLKKVFWSLKSPWFFPQNSVWTMIRLGAWDAWEDRCINQRPIQTAFYKLHSSSISWAVRNMSSQELEYCV